MTNVSEIEEEQRVRYRVAVEAMAQWVLARLDARKEYGEDFMEKAFAELRRSEAAERSEHLWIFRDPIALVASENLFDALEARPDGTRDWFHADLASAVAAVARFDVMAAMGEWMSAAGLEEGEARGV